MIKLHNIDRRYIFILIFLGVILPLFFPIGFKLEISENVRKVHDLIESTPADSKILLSFDYDTSSKPELQPAALAIIKHALSRDLKIVCMALWPVGATLADEIYKELAHDLEYGVNFINLGYKTGGLVTLQALGKDFPEVYTKDINGDNVNDFPIMTNVKNYSNFAFVASFSTGVPGMKEWILAANGSYGLTVTGATTAVSAPGFIPYINDQKQLVGLIGGLKAAAEYESLIGQPGKAISGLDAQAIALSIIVLFIIIGNVSWHIENKREKVI